MQLGAGQRGQVVVDPVGAGADEELVDVAVGADEVDVLAVLGAPEAVERGVGRRCHGAGQRGQVVVDPVGAGADEELVDVAVGADEVDVLAVVGAPEAVERGVGRRCHGAGQRGQVVVDPVGPGGDEELMHMVVGADEVDVLAAVPQKPTSAVLAAGATAPANAVRSLSTQLARGR